MSPSGLQHLSHLSLLRTLLLLSTSSEQQYMNIFNCSSGTAAVAQEAASAAGILACGQKRADKLSEGQSAQRVEAVAAGAAAAVEACTTYAARSTAESSLSCCGVASQNDNMAACTVNGGALACSLRELQFLHHLKVGVPFQPPASVLQLSELKRLQLLDLGWLGFEPSVLLQLEGSLPNTCRVLCTEDGESSTAGC